MSDEPTAPPMLRNVLSTLAWVLVVPTGVGVVIPWLLAGVDPHRGHLSVPGWLAWAVIVLGLATYLPCLWQFVVYGRGSPNPFDPPRQFVARGNYRYVRNPMYVSFLTAMLGVALLLASALALLFVVVVAVGLHVWIVNVEEPGLQQRFGDSYAAYVASVPRWLPRRPGASR